MHKLSKILTFLSVVFATLLLFFAVSSVWNWTKKNLLSNCVYFVGSDVVEYSPNIRNFAQSSENWYVLTDDEAQSVLVNIPIQNCSFINSQPQDLKEKRLKIAVRKTSGDGFEIIVWSKGFDNISGTADDIVFPSDEKVPN